MKKILVEIPDKLILELRNQLIVKHLAGTSGGTLDEFMFLLLGAIQDDKSEVKIDFNKKKQKKRRKK